ncbi:MAG: trigger factor [Candidatus Omnitrophica bacterium]|nr:trigger factor [Candidatus Omnitrophota bacterium]
MDVKLNRISPNQIELEIEIPIPQMENYFQLAARELSKDMKVDGFRPGKVPAEIVEREKGSQKLYDQAANLAIRKTLPEAILENKIEIVGQPDIVVIQIARGNPMKYKATFWTIPEVELGKYKELRVKRKELRVKQEEIDKSLEHLQKSRTKLVTVNRPAKFGDRVEIDFVTRSSGIKVEGGESKNHPLIIGESRFIPGFEKELEGMKSEEEKSFTLRVPKDWPQKNLAGRILDFQVKTNLIQQRNIPELSDEFAKSLGNFDSLNQLKQNIKEGLIQEKELREKERIRMELIEKVAQNSKMDIPEALINIELDKMVNELRGSVENIDLGFDKYLQGIKKTVDDLKKEWRSQAEKRVRISLVLREIAKKEKIEISDKEVVERIDEAEKNIDNSAFKEYTKGVIRNEKVFQLLEREAKII